MSFPRRNIFSSDQNFSRLHLYVGAKTFGGLFIRHNKESAMRFHSNLYRETDVYTKLEHLKAECELEAHFDSLIAVQRSKYLEQSK